MSQRLVPLRRAKILAPFTLRDEEADLNDLQCTRINTSHVAMALVSFMRRDSRRRSYPSTFI